MRADAREVEAFLRTARLDPDDDTPRLILADYLEENGEADRAEFIRVQCQLAAWVPEARERMALQRRERELLAGHRDEWLGPFAGWGQGHTRFRRGMIEAIVLGNPLPGRISPWVSRLRYRDADLSIAHWFSVAHEIDFGSGLTMVEAVNDAHEAGVKRIVVGWPEPGDAFDELPDHPAWPFPRLSRLVLEGATAMRILLTPPGPTWMAEYMPPEPGQTPPTFLNSIGMRLNLIPAGSYIRGTAEAQDGSPLGDEPPREVRITRPFYAGAYQVTRAQYYRVVGEPNTIEGGPDADRHPVAFVSWENARAFCEALTNSEDEEAAGRRYRLPTEAEWEYFCRAGSSTRYHWGDQYSEHFANARNQLPSTSPVGSYPANDWGLYDTHGNVREWCADWYARDYYRTAPLEDPPGPDSGESKVLRGGSFDVADADHVRSAYRVYTVSG